MNLPALLSAASLVLISFDQLAHPPTLTGLAAIVLLFFATTIGLFSHRRMRRHAFETVVSHYADRQIQNDARPLRPTPESRSTVS